jgi:hypothetical protein
MSSLKQRKRARRDPAPTIRVGVACNGDGGYFVGLAEGLSFSCRGETLDLDLSGGSAPRFTECEETIRIFRREFKVLDCASHVGNWCWNEYEVSLNDAVLLLNLALRSRKFTVSGASGNNACRLSDAIDEAAPVGELAIYLGMFGVSA